MRFLRSIRFTFKASKKVLSLQKQNVVKSKVSQYILFCETFFCIVSFKAFLYKQKQSKLIPKRNLFDSECSIQNLLKKEKKNNDNFGKCEKKKNQKTNIRDVRKSLRSSLKAQMIS